MTPSRGSLIALSPAAAALLCAMDRGGCWSRDLGAHHHELVHLELIDADAASPGFDLHLKPRGRDVAALLRLGRDD